MVRRIPGSLLCFLEAHGDCVTVVTGPTGIGVSKHTIFGNWKERQVNKQVAGRNAMKRPRETPEEVHQLRLHRGWFMYVYLNL